MMRELLRRNRRENWFRETEQRLQLDFQIKFLIFLIISYIKNLKFYSWLETHLDSQGETEESDE